MSSTPVLRRIELARVRDVLMISVENASSDFLLSSEGNSSSSSSPTTSSAFRSEKEEEVVRKDSFSSVCLRIFEGGNVYKTEDY
jgi:Cys-tRNA synthase (O-phospho-L-seryl-tRNA:Cys-tRNA synthase)